MAGGSTPSRRFGSTYGTVQFASGRSTQRAQHECVGTTPSPGVPVEWRKDGDHWTALVAFVDPGRIVVAWLSSDLVRPAGR